MVVFAQDLCNFASMTNWDDRRYFLAVARAGSIKKAAIQLDVNRSTVLRRVGDFQEALGVRLFERLPDGYVLTAAGEEMFRSVERMEKEAYEADRRLAGNDDRLLGKIRVTMPSAFATHLLMPDIEKFRRTYNEIELDLITSTSMADLARREADVAIRMSNNPPEDLVGRRVLTIASAGYVCANNLPSPKNELSADLRWLVWSDEQSAQQWVENSDFPHLPTGAVINDPIVALNAAQAGLGMAMLPCFLGDTASDLFRMPPGNLHLHTDLWVLTHSDLRRTARIRTLTAYITDALLNKKPLLEGNFARDLPA